MAYVPPRSVLVIEPDLRARREIADILLVNGLLVLCSVGAREALKLLRDGLTPDVLVFDARRSLRELATFARSQEALSLPTVAVVRSPRRPDESDTPARVTRATLDDLASAITATVDALRRN